MSEEDDRERERDKEGEGQREGERERSIHLLKFDRFLLSMDNLEILQQ